MGFVDAHLQELKTAGGLDHSSFRTMFPTVDQCILRVDGMKQDGNAGSYHKAAAELFAFGVDHAKAAVHLEKAIELFNTEEPAQVAGLVSQCTELKTFCDSQVLAAAKKKSNGTVEVERQAGEE